MSIYIQVYDNDEAYTVYYIPQNISVYPDETNLESYMKMLISIDTSFETNVLLNEGPFMESIQDIQRIASLLNFVSLSDKLGLILIGYTSIFPQIYGPLSNYSGVISVIFFIK